MARGVDDSHMITCKCCICKNIKLVNANNNVCDSCYDKYWMNGLRKAMEKT